MGHPSQVNDPFSWKDWFNAFINKLKNAGPHKIPDMDVRKMNHAFIAGWHSRGAAELFARTQMREQLDAVIKGMDNDVITYGKQVEEEQDAMDDLMDDLKNNPDGN